MEEPEGIRYGPGQLPVEYTPIRWDELVVGEKIGPIEFEINSETHQRLWFAAGCHARGARTVYA